MYITDINLTNYKIFEKLSLGDSEGAQAPIHRNMNVIIGDNGAGKSAILSSIAKCAANFVYSIDPKTKVDHKLSNLEINNNSHALAVEIMIAFDSEIRFQGMNKEVWEVTAKRSPRSTPRRPKFAEKLNYSKIVKEYLVQEEFDHVLPVIMNYGVERSALTIPRRNTSDKNYERILQFDEMLNGKSDFRQFFEWVEDVENKENQKIREMLTMGHREGVIPLSSNPSLNSVRDAIEYFLDGFSNLRIDRTPGGKSVLIEKESQTFNVAQLSQGERNLLALVGDIAKNLAIMYPNSKNPLKESGIILIDEVDMHLHPSWQSDILDKFMSTFPNCQFFVTTHSPLVISTVDRDINLIGLGGGCVSQVDNPYGWSADWVLREKMNAPDMESALDEKIEEIHRKLDEGNISEAQYKFDESFKNISVVKNSRLSALSSRVEAEKFLLDLNQD